MSIKTLTRLPVEKLVTYSDGTKYITRVDTGKRVIERPGPMGPAGADGSDGAGWHVLTDAAFGGVGDGLADNTAALRAAIAVVEAAGGGTIYAPRGTYMIDFTLPGAAFRWQFPDNVNLIGEETGWIDDLGNDHGTIFRARPESYTANAPFSETNSTMSGFYPGAYSTFADFMLDGNYENVGAEISGVRTNGIRCEAKNFHTGRNVTVRGCVTRPRNFNLLSVDATTNVFTINEVAHNYVVGDQVRLRFPVDPTGQPMYNPDGTGNVVLPNVLYTILDIPAANSFVLDQITEDGAGTELDITVSGGAVGSVRLPGDRKLEAGGYTWAGSYGGRAHNVRGDYNGRSGIQITGMPTGYTTSDFLGIDCRANHNDWQNIVTHRVRGAVFRDSIVSGADNNGFTMEACTDILFDNCASFGNNRRAFNSLGANINCEWRDCTMYGVMEGGPHDGEMVSGAGYASIWTDEPDYNNAEMGFSAAPLQTATPQDHIKNGVAVNLRVTRPRIAAVVKRRHIFSILYDNPAFYSQTVGGVTTFDTPSSPEVIFDFEHPGGTDFVNSLGAVIGDSGLLIRKTIIRRMVTPATDPITYTAEAISNAPWGLETFPAARVGATSWPVPPLRSLPYGASMTVADVPDAASFPSLVAPLRMVITGTNQVLGPIQLPLARAYLIHVKSRTDSMATAGSVGSIVRLRRAADSVLVQDLRLTALVASDLNTAEVREMYFTPPDPTVAYELTFRSDVGAVSPHNLDILDVQVWLRGADDSSLADMTGLYQYEDFASGANNSSGNVGDLGWQQVGAPATAAMAWEAEHPGIVSITTGGLAAAYNGIRLQPGNLIAPVINRWFVWSFRLPAALTANDVIRIGDISGTTEDITVGAYLEASGPLGDTTWRFVTEQGGITRTDTGIPINTSWVKLWAKYTSAGVMVVRVNDGNQMMIRTHVPTAEVNPSAYVYQVNAGTARLLYLDAFEHSTPAVR